jgi:hypothetical protein
MFRNNFEAQMRQEDEFKARHKRKALKAVIGILSFVSVVVLALCIPAIVIGFQGEPACANTYNGISFTFAKWLQVFGIFTIASLILIVTLSITALQLESKEIAGIMPVIGGLTRVFSVAWFVVGAILYWKTIDENCSNEPIGQYGLAWFIIMIIGFALDIYNKTK